MQFIDLFAGIGGFHLGLEKANNNNRYKEWENSTILSDASTNNESNQLQRTSFSCVWANEWDKWAGKVYQTRFPETPFNSTDIRLVKANDIPKADLLCAGFPCQAFSIAGKRKGFEETRGTLFYEICRIAKAKRIPYLLLENVKGLLSAQDRFAFFEIINCLDELGYLLQWETLNSKNFGVPQNRERVFIIGCLGKKRFKQIFPLGQSNEILTNKNNTKQVTKKGIQMQNITSTIDARYGALRNSGETYVQENQLIELTQNQAEAQRIFSINGIARTIKNGGGQGAKTGLYEVYDDYNSKMRTDGIVGTITQNIGNKATRNGQKIVMENLTERGHKTIGKIRRLTPTECERLQGYPDGWTKIEGISDSQRYKMIGNAVTTNVIQTIGEKILQAKMQ